jgi:hypothetical protein
MINAKFKEYNISNIIFAINITRDYYQDFQIIINNLCHSFKRYFLTGQCFICKTEIVLCAELLNQKSNIFVKHNPKG